MARNPNQDETELISTDPKYRNFAQQVDKALRSFEYTSEWADLVNALGKLNKTLQNGIKFQMIPRRFMIGQRLAQCMHPALPSGVHLKALETYDLIFKIIDSKRLVQELGIYSNGLFPLLCQAAINVKPTLLEIYETYFLPLGKDLKPCLDGFIIAILPGLEEGSEYHDSTDRLLKGVRDQVGSDFFYGSLWKCILSNPNVRLPAVSFIVSHYNKKKKLEDQLYIMGNDRKSLVYGICISLLDLNILVQRAILDLLITCFPLSQCKMDSDDITLILTAGFTVLLRRDTSLNRRLDSWLFGLEVSGQTFLPNKDNKKLTTEQISKARKKREKREQYFAKYTKEHCLSAFTLSLSNPSQVIPFVNLCTSLGEIWPYKLLLCVFDYFELINSVLDSLCIEIFRALYFDLNDQRMKQENLKFCNILISNLGVGYLWHQFSKLFSEACLHKDKADTKFEPADPNNIVQPVGSCSPSPSEILAIMDFFIEITSVESFPDSIAQYLPANLSQILNCLDEYFIDLNPEEMRLAILLLIKMVLKILPCQQYEVSKEVGKAFDCLSDIKEECESLTSEIIKASESALNSNNLDKQIDQINAPTSMQKLVKELEKFFSNVVRHKLVSNSDKIDDCFDHLINFKNVENQPRTIDIVIDKQFVMLYSDLCELLIKTSLMITNEDKSSTIKLDKNDFKLSNWLKELLVLGVYSTNMEVNYCSIKTVLKLMSILKSQLLDEPYVNVSDSSPSNSPILNAGKLVAQNNVENKSTCIDFMLTQFDIQQIYERTGYFLRITEILWSNLGEEKNFIHFETANLIQQVHNLVEDSEVCENVICNSMRSTDESLAYDARKKFCILFNITRNLKSKPKTQFCQRTSTREFDKPIFFMLDSLTHKLDSHNVLSVDWLTHCVNNGDIARVLEPLLVILLHPDTHRVCIQNVNIQQPEITEPVDKLENDHDISLAESKIYAISSQGGNVVYHINPEGKKRFISSPSHRQITITSTNDSIRSSKKWSNFKPTASEYEISHQDGANNNKHLSINMFSNPFGSISSLDSFENSNLDSRKSDQRSRIIKTPEEKRSLVNQKYWKDTDSEVIASLVEELVDTVVEQLEAENEDDYSSASENTTKTLSESLSMMNLTKPISISQLHSHILLYVQIYDSKRTFYALTTLWNVILAEPQRMLFTLATTSISNRQSIHTEELQHFFGRHKKSLNGKGFHGVLSPELINPHKNSSFLEIIVTTCLYYVRSYYPSVVQNKSSDDEIYGNQKVRILSCEILKLIFSELISAIKNRQTFSNYVHDMLNRCNVQKYILHTIVSSVYNFQLKSDKKIKSEDVFSETLIDFNERTGSHGFQEDMQKSLLKLLEQLMILEYRSSPFAGQNEKTNRDSKKDNDSRASKIRFQPQMSSLKYVPNAMIPAQSMFLAAIQTSLQQTHKSNLHSNWLTLVEATLPIAHRSLTRIMVCIVTQLCHNLEDVANRLEDYSTLNQKHNILQPNYLIILLKSFSNLLHHCLLDINSNHVVNQITQQPQQALSKNLSNSTSSLGPFQALTNFFHTITPGDQSTVDYSSSSTHNHNHLGDLPPATNSESMLITRKSILSHLSKILSALLRLWKVINELESSNSDKGWQIMGSIKDLRQQILNLLSPISLIHGQQFLASVAILWHELKDKNQSESKRTVVPNCSVDQKHLVNLVASIRVLTMDSVFQQIKQVMKSPPQNIQFRKKRIPLEVCMLQFSLCYIKEFNGSQLLDCWKSLLNLLKDGSQIASSQPVVQFHLLAILHEFVQISPLIEDRKDQKDLQDVSQKLIDACVTVASGRLGQTRWLRRNLEVKPGPQHIDHDDESELEVDENKYDSTSYNVNNEATMARYSVQALNALAQFVAPVLDVVYVSEEKEKVIPLVSNIMYYVTPYLKNHSKHNAPSFYSCSDLLASISGYQYLRKAWRKDAFELLLEPNFFQMEVNCVGYWRTVVDHLMTHDKTTFNDFLTKMSQPIGPGAGLNKLFSSKEQENDLRAQLTKRLAFILFCSEKDQYMKYMSEIQEKIIEFLRVNSSPIVLSNIFLCFRVLILRMSSHQLTSLWPFIYTELSQIFLQVETELLRNSSNNESFYQPNNGSNTAGYLQMYLQACKFLDLAISLPADSLPQFQLDRWSFISSVNSDDQMGDSDFEPQISRIEKLMRLRNPKPKLLPYKRRSPLLNQTEITDLMSLHSFFYTLLQIEGNRAEEERINESDRIAENCFRNNKMAEQFERDHEKEVDGLIELDFVESLQN